VARAGVFRGGQAIVLFVVPNKSGSAVAWKQYSVTDTDIDSDDDKLYDRSGSGVVDAQLLRGKIRDLQ
jgi:hypothetical protein